MGHPSSSGPGRLVAQMAPPGTWTTLAEHRSRFAPPPRVRRQPNEALIESAERSGLRGRGGASFPTAVKFRAVAGEPGRGRPVVLVNGSEGEPTSQKDALLMASAPHLVIDGALAAAAAVGAEEIVFALKATAPDARRAVARALAEQRNSDPSIPRTRLIEVPDRYVAGEERALVNLVNRGRAIPPSGTTRPFEKGVRGRPTLVQNVETLAHLALVNQGGPEWFRSVGTERSPGTTLVTVGGAVVGEGVYEIDAGTTFEELMRVAGGPTEDIGSVLIGGYAGAWLTAAQAMSARLDHESLVAIGGVFGCGSVVVLPKSSCGLQEMAATMRWMATQSAGQCGPCVFGLDSIAGAAEDLRDGRADRQALTKLARWSDSIEGRGACRLPDGAVRLMRSALDAFAEDALAHSRGRRCPGTGRALVLPLPRSRQAA